MNRSPFGLLGIDIYMKDNLYDNKNTMLNPKIHTIQVPTALTSEVKLTLLREKEYEK